MAVEPSGGGAGSALRESLRRVLGPLFRSEASAWTLNIHTLSVLHEAGVVEDEEFQRLRELAYREGHGQDWDAGTLNPPATTRNTTESQLSRVAAAIASGSLSAEDQRWLAENFYYTPVSGPRKGKPTPRDRFWELFGLDKSSEQDVAAADEAVTQRPRSRSRDGEQEDVGEDDGRPAGIQRQRTREDLRVTRAKNNVYYFWGWLPEDAKASSAAGPASASASSTEAVAAELGVPEAVATAPGAAGFLGGGVRQSIPTDDGVLVLPDVWIRYNDGSNYQPRHAQVSGNRLLESLYHMPDEQLAFVRAQLARAGYYGQAAPSLTGPVNSSDVAAFAEAINQAGNYLTARRPIALEDLLEQQAAALEQSGFAVGGGGGGSEGYVIELESPASLEMVLEDQARQLLGRRPTDDELSRYVEAFHDLERQYQQPVTGDAGTGGFGGLPAGASVDEVRELARRAVAGVASAPEQPTVEEREQPNAVASASQFLKAQNPGEFLAHEGARGYESFIRIIGGRR